MKAFFDTSVLLPCLQGDHIHHAASLQAFISVNAREGSCAAHSLAELYANATRLPGKNRVKPEQVLLFLGDVRERLSIVGLTPDEYYATLKDAAGVGLMGATIDDALLGACALKSEAEIIYTWNLRHFQQLSPEITQRLRTP